MSPSIISFQLSLSPGGNHDPWLTAVLTGLCLKACIYASRNTVCA